MSDDIEDIRERKMRELQEKAQEQEREQMEERQQEAEMQKEAILKEKLSEGARRRLNTVQMAKPEFGEQVEQQILALIQSGRVQSEIDEDTMKELLRELSEDESDDYDIKGMGSRR